MMLKVYVVLLASFHIVEGEPREDDYDYSSVSIFRTRTKANPVSWIKKHPFSNSSQAQILCFFNLGCFNLAKPWISTSRHLPYPMNPDVISTKLYLYTRKNITQRQYVHLYPHITLTNTTYNADEKSVFLIHGFSSNGNSTWMENMKDGFLQDVNVNVFIVDWGPGASMLNYLQVVSNIRIVACELSRFIILADMKPSKIHIVGHSLGAHVASYVSKNVKGIGRLTALDPAEPMFEDYSQRVRLDQSDALFVDVIHTNAKQLVRTYGIGMLKPHGHVDFYVNGGLDQPGCFSWNLAKRAGSELLTKFNVEVLSDIVSCSHGRAVDYFIESLIGDCIFWGVHANITDYQENNTSSNFGNCTLDTCIPIGLLTQYSKIRGSVIVQTHSNPPFCKKEL